MVHRIYNAGALYNEQFVGFQTADVNSTMVLKAAIFQNRPPSNTGLFTKVQDLALGAEYDGTGYSRITLTRALTSEAGGFVQFDFDDFNFGNLGAGSVGTGYQTLLVYFKVPTAADDDAINVPWFGADYHPDNGLQPLQGTGGQFNIVVPSTGLYRVRPVPPAAS